MEKIIAVSILILLILTGIYFFNKDKLSGTAFTAFILGLIFLFIGFYSIDRLKEFNVTGMKLVLSEMKDTKSNFDSTVAILLEILSELNIDYTSNQGMMIGGPIPEKLIKTRSKSVKMLGLAGKSEQEIALQTIKIDRTILGLYASQIVRDILKKSSIFNQKNKQERSDITAILKEKKQRLWRLTSVEFAAIDDFETVLKNNDFEEELYSKYIADMRYYLKEKKLRRPFKKQF